MNQTKLTRSEQKRQAIVEAAKIAFKEFGVQATSMDKLAAMAQVSKRTVYNHFESKEALVVHLCAELGRHAMQQLAKDYDPALPLDSQLEALVRAEIEVLSCSDYIELVRVAIGHYFYHPEELEREAEKIRQQETAMTRWIKAATEDGKLAIEDPTFASNQLHSMVKGSCFWPQLFKIMPVLDEQERNHIAHEHSQLFLARYRNA